MANKSPIYDVGEEVEAMLNDERRPAHVAQIKKTKGRREYKLEFQIGTQKRVTYVAVGDERGKIFPIKDDDDDDLDPGPARAPARGRGRAPARFPYPTEVPRIAFEVTLPLNLKRLANEVEAKINDGFLVTLPMNVTVATIVDDCIEAFLADPFMINRDLKICITRATIRHFDAMLQHQLLYDFEREQHREFYYATTGLPPGAPITNELAQRHGLQYAQHYGIAHYLRLMIRMPRLASVINPSGNLAEQFKETVAAICLFLNGNLYRYVQPNMYHTTTLGYQRLVN